MKKKSASGKYSIWQNTAFMLKIAWKEKRSVIWLCVVLACVMAVRSVTEILLSPAILDKVEQAASFGGLAGTIAAFSGALVVLAGLQSYVEENASYARLAMRFQAFSNRATKKWTETSYPNLMDANFGDKKARVIGAYCGPGSAAETIWETWTQIIADVLRLVIYLSLMVTAGPELILICAATAVVSYLAGKHASERGREPLEKMDGPTGRMQYAIDSAGNRQYAKDIRIFGLQGWMRSIWDSGMERLKELNRKRSAILLKGDAAGAAMNLLRNGLVYLYLIGMVAGGNLTAAQFLLYFGTASGISTMIDGILGAFYGLHQQSEELNVMREFLEWEEPFLFEEGKSLPKELSSCEIRLEDVSYRYPGAQKDTISHMNLTLHPGEKLAMVGLNGAGKTTLVKLICGFFDPTQGRVLLNGQDIRQYNRKEYYGLFAAVFQSFSVVDCTVAQNVAQEAKEIDRERVARCLEQAGLLEKVGELPQGMNTYLGRELYEEGVELSGGQNQRLMLARALYKNADILLLDEPTAALDPIAENDIYMRYSRMTEGKTALFISHRLASTQFCDRILFLKDGLIAEEGTHRSLLEQGGEYAKLFEIQSRYYREEKNDGK